MGLFNHSEEEFLDPDEIRLRRESEKRRRAEHKQCVADHSADYNSPIHPANNTKPHDDCHADHRDDRPTTYPRTNPNTFSNNKVVIIAIVISIIFMLMGFLLPIIFTLVG